MESKKEKKVKINNLVILFKKEKVVSMYLSDIQHFLLLGVHIIKKGRD